MNPDEALAILTQHLRTLALQKYPRDEYGDPVTFTGEWTNEASPAPNIARKWVHELLSAANADGAGGCRLCKG